MKTLFRKYLYIFINKTEQAQYTFDDSSSDGLEVDYIATSPVSCLLRTYGRFKKIDKKGFMTSTFSYKIIT